MGINTHQTRITSSSSAGNYLLRLWRQAAKPTPAATVLSRIRLPGSGTAATLSLEVICANIAAQVIAINERVNKVRFTFGLARN